MRRLNENASNEWTDLGYSSNLRDYKDALGITNDHGQVIILLENSTECVCILSMEGSNGLVDEAITFSADVDIHDIMSEVEKKLDMSGTKLINYLESKYHGHDHSFKNSSKLKNEVTRVARGY